MNKLEELIKRLCPNGVEYKRLNEVFENFNGMTGVSNKWKEWGNCQFIEYMNAYKNLKINTNLLPFATVKKLEQNTLKKGDILLTCASETPDECAIASVIEDEIKDNVFLDDHLFGIRVNEAMKNKINTTFMNYYMHTNNFRRQVNKAVRGVTRFYISIDNFMQICIPVPPLEIQEEIVHILDNFTELSAELSKELSKELKAIQKQYGFYEEKLLNKSYKIVKLEEVCNICAGGTPSKTKSEYWNNGTIKWLGSTVCKNKKFIDEVTDYITELGLEKSAAKLMKEKTTLIAMVGATIGKVAFLDFEATTNQNVACLYPKNENELNPDYLYYACKNLYQKFVEFANGKFAMASLGFIKSLEISLPNIDEQRKIVSILEKLEKLCNDLSIGLPAEIEAREKQYEYYRDKLLNFKELKVEN